MISKRDLQTAISQLEQLPPTLSNCEKLSAYYIVYDHLYGEIQPQFSSTPVVDINGDSIVARAINGKDQQKVWDIVIELIDGLQVLAPKLYNATIDELNNI